MITKTSNPERTEYEAIVSSGIFPPGSNAARFLEYVCEEYFRGERTVTEYAIAVEAMGRRSDFDPKTDAIVRVEAHRVRKRLREYYENQGVSHSLRLTIPVGHYLPTFGAGNIESATPDSLSSTRAEVAASAVTRTWKLLPGRRGALLAAIFLLTGLGIVLGVLRREAKSRAPAVPAAAIPPLASSGAQSGVRIACGRLGAGLVDQLGRQWSADQYYTGGSAVRESYRRIFRTGDPALFLTAREGGDFGYDIPLQRGHYELRLYFAETEYGVDNPEGGGESSRMITIAANGKPLVSGFDPLSDAGGSNTADERVFEGITPAADGRLHLTFAETWPNKANPFVNAIAIVPNESSVMPPIRWVASDSGVVDSEGRLWQADQFCHGGRLRVDTETVTGTPDPELYRSSRFGNFSYALPVAPGTYTLTLCFDEYWFGVEGGGAGSRLFDVYCNGTVLLRDFDIFKNAGGSNIAVSRTFHGLRPNAQGKLMLSFVPVRDYATLAALEVVTENGN